MRKLFCSTILLSACAFAQSLLTNDVVLRMLNVSNEVILTMVSEKPSQFSLAAADLIVLKQAGVSDKIIEAMLSRGIVTSVSPAIPNPSLVLHDGTPVRLRLRRNLSSADAKSGDTLDFEVLEDVKVDETLVIARGAVAIGTVTEAQAKRRMARGGKLDITIDYVRLTNDDKAALRGVKETSGGGHTGAMTGAIVATSLVVWPAAPFFLFMHGKDTTIPKGTEITAYVNGEIKLKSTAMTTQAAAPLARINPSNMNPESLRKNEPQPLASNTITIRFTSVPASAEVDVDGEYWGSTPTAELKRMAAGTHTIIVEKIGYQHWERKITLAPGDDRTVNAELEPNAVGVGKPRITGLN
jgi:hypothetical protein